MFQAQFPIEQQDTSKLTCYISEIFYPTTWYHSMMYNSAVIAQSLNNIILDRNYEWFQNVH